MKLLWISWPHSLVNLRSSLMNPDDESKSKSQLIMSVGIAADEFRVCSVLMQLSFLLQSWVRQQLINSGLDVHGMHKYMSVQSRFMNDLLARGRVCIAWLPQECWKIWTFLLLSSSSSPWKPNIMSSQTARPIATSDLRDLELAEIGEKGSDQAWSDHNVRNTFYSLFMPLPGPPHRKWKCVRWQINTIALNSQSS